jgi:hypothetical protein
MPSELLVYHGNRRRKGTTGVHFLDGPRRREAVASNGPSPTIGRPSLSINSMISAIAIWRSSGLPVGPLADALFDAFDVCLRVLKQMLPLGHFDVA